MRPTQQGAIQGGTFAGSALGLAAATATMGLLADTPMHDELLARAERFFAQLQAVFDRSSLAARVQSVGSMFTIYVGTRDPVASYADMNALDGELARRFFTRCVDAGIYFHTDFCISAAHDSAVLDDVLYRMEGIVSQSFW